MKQYEEYKDYNHMAYMANIKLLCIKALMFLEDDTVCSKDQAIDSLKEAIYYIVQEEINEK